MSVVSQYVKNQAADILRRAMAVYGASCVPVWRMDRDANGVPIGSAEQIGCVYGVLYVRGQTANVLTDIPGVMARMDALRLCCTLSPCACSLASGDGLQIEGAWYTVLEAKAEMDILVDVILKEGYLNG